MRRAISFGTCALCAALAVACGGSRTAQDNNDTGKNAGAAAAFRDNAKDRPAPVDVQGCLTASGDRFMLTTLHDASAAGQPKVPPNGAATTPVPTTEAYQLISTGGEDLHQYVNQQVHVAGEADPARVADVRELTPPVPARQGSVGTSGNAATAGATPEVKTEEDTHFELRKLRVSSITPAGGSCPEAPSRQR